MTKKEKMWEIITDFIMYTDIDFLIFKISTCGKNSLVVIDDSIEELDEYIRDIMDSFNENLIKEENGDLVKLTSVVLAYNENDINTIIEGLNKNEEYFKDDKIWG